MFSGKGTLNSTLSVHREAGKGLKKAGCSWGWSLSSKDMRESEDTRRASGQSHVLAQPGLMEVGGKG